ncbi:MAG: enterochelin esterase, partial [Planctomyces sp.]|nr:enterochelin esterase [Planctomyces sp.]
MKTNTDRRIFIMAIVASVILPIVAAAEMAQAEEMSSPVPPAGFDIRRDEIPHGQLEVVEYDSTSIGMRRKARVYTPPGYASSQETFPVLYLLHGIGGDENEWARSGVPDIILDNLYADEKLVPMIVVLPNGRAAK